MLTAEGPDDVHLLVEAIYTPAGGFVGALLDLLVQRAHRRQALRDAVWRLEAAARGRGAHLCVRRRRRRAERVSASAERAIVFDLDGVLVDSEPAHLRASQRLVRPRAHQ